MLSEKSRNVEASYRPLRHSDQDVKEDNFRAKEICGVRRRDENFDDAKHHKRTKLDSAKVFCRTDESRPTKPSSVLGTSATTSSISSTELTFYPAYCHSLSPTWFAWVKLTASEIHQMLHSRDGYQHTLQIGYRPERNASVVLFYLNHPIQFVQVVGIVVNLESYFERFWLFTIDDSSGATIDVICNKPIAEFEGANTSLAPVMNNSNGTDGPGNNDDERLTELNKQVAEDVKIGTVVQVKGTVTFFQRRKGAAVLNGADRSISAPIDSTVRPQQPIVADRPIRQINLTRLRVVPSTNAEILLIDARTKFHASVLSKPWILSSSQVQKLRRKALGEVERVRKRSEGWTRRIVHIAAQETRDADLIQKEYEHEDEIRFHEAELARNAGRNLTRLKEKKIQNASSEPYSGSRDLDEKAALLRAAFG